MMQSVFAWCLNRFCSIRKTNCFGTADTIVFRNGTLRIHDLKTGVVPAHMEQLEIYDKYDERRVYQKLVSLYTAKGGKSHGVELQVCREHRQADYT